MNQPANILLLVSDPLDASISIQRDLDELQEALRELDAAAVFDTRVAEADAVQSHLARGDRPRYGALHYLGHGADPDGKFGKSLIFENADCLCDPIDPTRLAFALRGAAGEFPLAVVSACHSESVAASFFSVGARHVIAIEGSQSVYEVAAIAFCRRFYQSLLTGRPLSEAFAAGRDALFTDPEVRLLGNQVTQAEAAKFKLLNYPGADPAQFYLTAGRGQTELREPPALTAPPFDQHPSAGEFIGRNADMRDLIEKLNTHRAAVVLGVSGVGKTELAKQTARRLVARRRVDANRAGFASLVNVKSADDARAAIAMALGLPPDNIADNGALQRATPRHWLVILDEAENVIAGDGLAFRQLLDALIAAPGKPIVIVTSQTNPNTPKAPPVQVRRLSDVAAFRLFAANANLDWEQFQRINREHLLEALGYVDRLPRAIELVARVWWRERGADPDNLDLTSLLAQLRADRDRVMRDPDYPDEVKSVTVGVQYAYDRLKARSPEAAALWTRLALFPGGVSKAGLPQIFGDQAAALANEIEKQSLVEASFTHLPAPFGNLLELPTPFRYFALRHLPAGDEAAGRQEIGEAVLRYYFDFQEEPHRGWVGVLDQGIRESGATTGALIARFSAELPSIESWLDWAYDHEPCKSNRARAPRLTGLLNNLYVVTGELRKQRNRFNRALACAHRCGDSEGEANVLQVMGDLLMRVADLSGARVSYEKALPIYREIEDRLGEANVLRAMGDLLMRVADLTGARASYEKAASIYREIGSRLGEANVLKAMGDLLMRVADLTGARASYEKALPIYREIEARLGEANVLKAMGDLLMRVADLSGARASYEKALPIYREIEDRLGEANVLQVMGDLLIRVADLSGARASYEKALLIYREIESRLGEANVFQVMGDLLRRVDDLSGARASYEKALPIYREIGSRPGEANVLQAMGDLLMQVDDLSGARASYEKALPIYREIEARLGEANVLKAMGDLLMQVDDLSGARASYEKALSIYREIEDRLGEANVLQVMGDLLIRVADLSGARASYEKALPIYREIEDRLGEANVLASLGRLALAEGNEDEADRLLEMATAINQAIGERFNPALDSAKYGLALKERGKKEKARLYLLRAAELFAAIGFDDYAETCRTEAEESDEEEN